MSYRAPTKSTSWVHDFNESHGRWTAPVRFSPALGSGSRGPVARIARCERFFRRTGGPRAVSAPPRARLARA